MIRSKVSKRFPDGYGGIQRVLHTLLEFLSARFEINDENMRNLAHISDKYIIEALRKDLEV